MYAIHFAENNIVRICLNTSCLQVGTSTILLKKKKKSSVLGIINLQIAILRLTGNRKENTNPRNWKLRKIY